MSAIIVWYKNAHSVYPSVELQISTSPVATPSVGDDSNGIHQSLVPAEHVQPLSPNVKMVRGFAATKTNAVN